MKRVFVIAGIVLLVVVYVLLSFLRPSFKVAERLRDDCLVIAHRGGAEIGAENTLSCIEKGLSTNADMIEIDVHMTKDGHLVVCHDPTVDRTTDGSGAIRKMTLAQIKALHIVHDGVVTDETIPTFGEVLETVKGRAGILVEIKRKNHWYPGIEAATLDTLRAYGFDSSNAILQSFDDSVLEEFHRLGSEYRLEKLAFFKFAGLPLCFDMGLSYFSLKKYDYISSFNFYHRSVNARMIKYFHDHGKQVKVWTVLGPDSVRLLDYDAVITNRPDLF